MSKKKIDQIGGIKALVEIGIPLRTAQHWAACGIGGIKANGVLLDALVILEKNGLLGALKKR